MSSENRFDLSEQVAIVTGATQDIGRAIALAFAHHGARVAISGRDPKTCDEVAAKLNAAGASALGIACDFRDLDSRNQLVRLTAEQLGPVDILVANAGVIQLARDIPVDFGRDGIRASSSAPGLVKSEFPGPLWQDPELARERIDNTPLGGHGDPEDIAGAAVYLAARAGAFTTAQTLVVVDGGAVMVGR